MKGGNNMISFSVRKRPRCRSKTTYSIATMVRNGSRKIKHLEKTICLRSIVTILEDAEIKRVLLNKPLLINTIHQSFIRKYLPYVLSISPTVATRVNDRYFTHEVLHEAYLMEQDSLLHVKPHLLPADLKLEAALLKNDNYSKILDKLSSLENFVHDSSIRDMVFDGRYNNDVGVEIEYILSTYRMDVCIEHMINSLGFSVTDDPTSKNMYEVQMRINRSSWKNFEKCMMYLNILKEYHVIYQDEYCGTHVHLQPSSKSLDKAITVQRNYYMAKDVLIRLFDGSRCDNKHCAMIDTDISNESALVLEAMKPKSEQPSRGRAVNLLSIFVHGTIEFRQLEAILDIKVLSAFICLYIGVLVYNGSVTSGIFNLHGLFDVFEVNKRCYNILAKKMFSYDL